MTLLVSKERRCSFANAWGGHFQRDLHPGQLMVRRRNCKPELFLHDLQSINVDPFLTRAKRWRDLAARAGARNGASRSHRLGFFKSYLSIAPRLCADERRLQVWQSSRKQCLADNREFAKVQIGDFKGFVRRTEWNDGLKSLLNEPRRMLARAAIVKDSHATTVGSVALAGKGVFVKRYNYRGPAYALKDLFRSSRAKRVWQAGNSCYMRGIGVALPLAYLERRRFRILRESYLLTAAATGDELSQVLARQRDNVRGKRVLICQLARRLRRMHDRGVAHRDLKGENIIVQERGDMRYKFRIVDFDGVRCRPVFRRTRLKNLARLARAVAVNVPLTSADRFRLVKHYLCDGDSSRWREMYPDLLKRTKKYRGSDAR